MVLLNKPLSITMSSVEYIVTTQISKSLTINKIMPKLVPSSINIQFRVKTLLQLRIDGSSKGPDELTNLLHSQLAQLFYSNFTEALQFGFPEKDFRFFENAG